MTPQPAIPDLVARLEKSAERAEMNAANLAGDFEFNDPNADVYNEIVSHNRQLASDLRQAASALAQREETGGEGAPSLEQIAKVIEGLRWAADLYGSSDLVPHDVAVQMAVRIQALYLTKPSEVPTSPWTEEEIERVAQIERIAQIKHMVNRFLGWRLPADFSPDGGVSATRPNYGPGVEWTLYGTNLLSSTQAEAMVRYMLEGLPVSSLRPSPSPAVSREGWRPTQEQLQVLINTCSVFHPLTEACEGQGGNAQEIARALVYVCAGFFCPGLVLPAAPAPAEQEPT